MASFVGLDIGSYSVKVLHLESADKDAYTVTLFDEEILNCAFETHVSAENLKQSQQLALKELNKRDALSGNLFIALMPSEDVSLHTLTFPFTDSKKISQVLPFELEAEVPFKIEDLSYSWDKITASVSEGENESCSVLVCYTSKEKMADFLSLLQTVGIDPRRVEMDALALSATYNTFFKNNLDSFDRDLSRDQLTSITSTVVVEETAFAHAIVEIGHRSTTVCVLSDGQVIDAHSILHGGFNATKRLAKEINLSLEEAEEGKRKEAFIEVIGAEAQFSEQKQISDVLKLSYAPILRRIRQIFQSSLSKSKIRVSQVILSGGGSQITNLDRYFADQLKVHTFRVRELLASEQDRIQWSFSKDKNYKKVVPESISSLSAAYSGVASPNFNESMNLRRGEFAWKGELDFVLDKAASLFLWAGILFIIVLMLFAFRMSLLSSSESKIVKQQEKACSTILGQKITSINRCLSMVRAEINGDEGFRIPRDSAADLYLELSRRLPSKDVLERKVTSLDLTLNKMRMKGQTSDYDAVAKIFESIKGARCFTDVDQGKAKSIAGELIQFNFTAKIDCKAHAVGSPLDLETVKKSVKNQSSQESEKNDSKTDHLKNSLKDSFEESDLKNFDEVKNSTPSSPMIPAENLRREKKKNKALKRIEDRMQRLKSQREGPRPPGFMPGMGLGGGLNPKGMKRRVRPSPMDRNLRDLGIDRRIGDVFKKQGNSTRDRAKASSERISKDSAEAVTAEEQ